MSDLNLNTGVTAIDDGDVADNVRFGVVINTTPGWLYATFAQVAAYVAAKLFGSLTGNAGKYIKVNSGETGFDFGTGGGGGGTVTENMIVAVGDEATAITTGTGKVTFRMPYAFTVTGVRASLTTASSSGAPQVDINESGVSILSTPLTIDATEKTSTTAATAAVISDASLADDAEITIDIDTAGTGAAGLKVTLIGHQ